MNLKNSRTLRKIRARISHVICNVSNEFVYILARYTDAKSTPQIIAIARDVDVTTRTSGDCEECHCEIRKSETATANEISIAATPRAYVT